MTLNLKISINLIAMLHIINLYILDNRTKDRRFSAFNVLDKLRSIPVSSMRAKLIFHAHPYAWRGQFAVFHCNAVGARVPGRGPVPDSPERGSCTPDKPDRCGTSLEGQPVVEAEWVRGTGNGIGPR